MILQAINCIQKQLNPVVHCVTANIGEIIAGNANITTDPDIVISLINIEETRISRDPRNYLKSGPHLFLKNPAVHLNLTLLFTAIRSETAYDSALQNLQKVILFFQGKYAFDHINTPILDPGIEKLILEMITLNTEQLNHLWSIMGGRYQPSVIYKVRMVTIENISLDEGLPVKEVVLNF